ncbi:hypothetical protein HPB51_017945 [Rhipicephalus microplus]|uniref:Uncharacterized protein n=1 Tax=Rhipicephalus microplus TaxID=6941 RepID=A0A9J6EP25_RHIMP|nr:hypothetical protein HPB51_017945 [Rhipicephalus microplus]
MGRPAGPRSGRQLGTLGTFIFRCGAPLVTQVRASHCRHPLDVVDGIVVAAATQRFARVPLLLPAFGRRRRRRNFRPVHQVRAELVKAPIDAGVFTNVRPPSISGERAALFRSVASAIGDRRCHTRSLAACRGGNGHVGSREEPIERRRGLFFLKLHHRTLMNDRPLPVLADSDGEQIDGLASCFAKARSARGTRRHAE